ncbi:MAG: ABC-F family ATP-binding cassette domain-containing protein, partial [Tissierellia bacterium]|nr:ABC-F family ATP-binding cassette domain-containing protein [Tissierellia bacterium]
GEKPKPVFPFKKARTPGPIIFQTRDLVIGYDRPLTQPLNLQMIRSQKIAIVGANGLGKTSLIKSLLGLIPAFAGTVERGDFMEIGYFEQELVDPGTDTCIEHFWQEFPGYTQYEVRAALAKCGLITNQIESQVRVLSGGEQAKVRLAKLINHPSNVLVLDEPTNHLDQDAKTALKQALKEYTGSILMVSHEPEFYQDIVSDVWDVKTWK